MSKPAPLPELERAEAWLLCVTTDPAGIAAGIRRAASLGAGVADAFELERMLTPGPRLTALERVAIYHEGYFSRLRECLLDDYPAVAHLLGTHEFERIAREYVAATPSRSPSLNEYGRAMPDFLRSRAEPWSAFAAELAELEWALVESIHSEAPSPLTPAALTSVRADDWPHVRLAPSPALRLLSFRYPVNAFYQAFRSGAEPLLPRPEPSHMAVHREGITLFRHDLTPLAARLLAVLIRGTPLGAALTALEHDTSPTDLTLAESHLSEWFGTWISAGFFTALSVSLMP
jgi:hypothetical protein